MTSRQEDERDRHDGETDKHGDADSHAAPIALQFVLYPLIDSLVRHRRSRRHEPRERGPRRCGRLRPAKIFRTT
jgi:hypothetical protein